MTYNMADGFGKNVNDLWLPVLLLGQREYGLFPLCRIRSYIGFCAVEEGVRAFVQNHKGKIEYRFELVGARCFQPGPNRGVDA